MYSNNLKLPIRAAPYRHQREAFYFVLRLFGLLADNEAVSYTHLDVDKRQCSWSLYSR